MTARSVRARAAVALLLILLTACSDSSSDNVATIVPAGPTTAVPRLAVPTPVAPMSSPADPTPAGKTPSHRPAAPSPSTDRHAALGADFTLAAGESVRIDGTDIVVTFTRVIDDSRCPTEVTCIRQGEARIAVKVRGAGAPATLELQTPAAEGSTDVPGNEKRVGNYLLHLESVDPWPKRPAADSEDAALTATLRVTRA